MSQRHIIKKLIILDENYEPIVIDVNLDPLQCQFPDCGAVVEVPGICKECLAMLERFEFEAEPQRSK